MTSRGIIRTYLGIAASTTLAQSLIWGINTLFLLSVGLDIYQVMLVNAAYTVSQAFFEVPTGVVADTLGRRASYLLAVGIILASTLLYLWFGLAHFGVWPFAAASALLGLGYTFYTGAVDAWMVDALHSVDYPGRLEPIFARYGITFGIFMLIGTTAGGFLGQVDLWIPYALRAVILVPAFLLGVFVMRDLGFKGRPLTAGSFARETRRIARAGVTFGLQGPHRALHHVRLARAGRVLHVRLLLVAEVLPRPAGAGPRVGDRRHRGAGRAHADPRQRAGGTHHGARARPRPHPHGVRRRLDGGHRRRRPGAGASGSRCRSTSSRPWRSASRCRSSRAG